MSLDKRFLVSVADAIVRDPNTQEILFVSKANITTNIDITMDNNEIAGGFNNALQFLHYYNRRMNIEIESSEWRKDFLSSQVGKQIATRNEDVFKTECRPFTSGSATVTQTPVGDVTIINASGAFITTTPSGMDLTGVNVEDGDYTVLYQFNTQVEAIDIDSNTSPLILDLTLQIPEFNQAGVVGTSEFAIPRFAPDGNFALNFTSSGVTSSSLTGQALALADGECETGQNYAVYKFIPNDASTLSLQSIVAQHNNADSVDAPAGAQNTYQLNIIGIRGGNFGNRPVPVTECTFAMEAGSDADITVAGTGLITVTSSGTSGDMGTVVVTHTASTLTSQFNVDIV